MGYRLLALDLDGTLLNSALKLSETNGEAVRKAMDAGIQIVFATTRWYGLAKRTADRVGIDTPLVCSNGGLVKRPADGRELRHLYLDADLAREVVTLADDSGWEKFTTIGDTTYMQMRPGVIEEKLPAGLKVADRHAERLSEGPPTCVLVFGNDAVEELSSRYEGDGRANFSFNRPVGTPHYVVMTHPEADKASALDVVCKELGIAPEDTVAMGDSESDIGMLRYAGMGIAMRNSPDEVKKNALHIAPSNDEDGVAWALLRFVL